MDTILQVTKSQIINRAKKKHLHVMIQIPRLNS